MMHLMGGIVLLSAVVCAVSQVGAPQEVVQRVTQSVALRALLLVTFVRRLAQVALGGWVSADYAVLACPDLPKGRKSWVAIDGFRAGL